MSDMAGEAARVAVEFRVGLAFAGAAEIQRARIEPRTAQ